MAMDHLIQNKHTLVIEAGKTELHYWRDLWHFRELLYFLAWRDVIVRYKQTVIGIAWALVRPFMTMIVFTVVFGKLAKMPSDNVPYPILVFVGLLPWQFFAGAFSDAGNSLISNSNLISKIYFPRLLVPASAIVVNLVDFLISVSILIALMVWYKFIPDWRVIVLPFFILWVALLALGSGLFVAALNVKFRDFRYILPFIIQFGLYISPVGFVSSVIPEKWRLFYYLNPLAGVIDGFRWAVLGNRFEIYVPGMVCSALISFCFCYFGIKYFRSTEKTFVDVL
jgi:lipopolysaccharide transport system permease protein